MIVVPISSLLQKLDSNVKPSLLKHFSALFLFHKIVCITNNTSMLRINFFFIFLHKNMHTSDIKTIYTRMWKGPDSGS